MNHDKNVESRVAEWLDDEARGEFPDWVLAETFEQTRPEGQGDSARPPTPSITRNQHRATPPRRPSMSHLTRLAAAAIIGIFGAGLIFTMGDDPGPDPAPVPAAEGTGVVAAAEIQAPTEFTARMLCGDAVRSQTIEKEPFDLDGQTRTLFRHRGAAYRPVFVAMTDPRLDGSISISVDSDEYGGATGPYVESGTVRIWNEAGSWEGSFHTIGRGDTRSTTTMPLTGAGAYEGLTAIWEAEFSERLSCVIDVRGMVIGGDVPVFPEPPADDAPMAGNR